MIKTRVLMDYKIPCIDIAETQRARIISKYSYLFSPVNSIGYLMNAIRLRQNFSVRAVQLEGPVTLLPYRTSVCQRMKNITHTPVYADIR
jgi:hypothetical protein